MDINKDVSGLIDSIESDYLEITLDYVSNIFGEHHLPSHDASHHRRVWQYAKQYLLHKGKVQQNISKEMITGLFFSCFFHDTGMSITLSKNHGRHSRMIFKEFTGKVLKTELPNHAVIAEAIEKHDEKEFLSMNTEGFDQQSEILRILTICDDLDAFGAIGVLRYTEIYLLREIPELEIPARVLENIKFRTDFFMRATKDLTDLKGFHEKRIRFINNFFREAQLPGSNEKLLIQAVKTHVITQKCNYKDLAEILEKNYDLLDFTESLRQEFLV